MAENEFDVLGPFMSEIGQELTDISGGDPEGVFLYAEIGEGWVSPSVFKDEGSIVRDLDFDKLALCELLFDAWYASPEGKRWCVMEYDITQGVFSVSFKYPDEVDVESFEEDRREVALRARYGDKQVIYPPPPEGAFELNP